MSRTALPLPSTDDLRAALERVPARRVECAVGDFTSLARGKVVAASDFVGMAGCRLPSVVFGLTLTAGEPDAVFGPLLPEDYADVRLVPDLATLAPRPGRPGEATVICEPVGQLAVQGGEMSIQALSPRAALRHVMAQFRAAGLQALAAPELEMFLLKRTEHNGQVVLGAAEPYGHAGASERVTEVLCLERASHFDAYFDELYAACEVLGIPMTGHAHESALSQYEVNFAPGDPLAQADAVWRFKRLAREVALRHGFMASFAPKPFLDLPGTGMHWHFSVQRPADAAWPHVFATPAGEDSPALHHFIAGLQRHAPAAMALFAPHDMAFDRIALSDASPSHASWGHEARSLAFRIPASGGSSRRIENRLPGGDANPYLTVAATLGLGLLGLREGALPVPGQPDALALPANLPHALNALAGSEALRGLLGSGLVEALVAIKRHEHDERRLLADPRQQWDMAYLLEAA